MEVQSVVGTASIVMTGVSAFVLTPVVISWWNKMQTAVEVRSRVRGKKRDTKDCSASKESPLSRLARQIEDMLTMAVEEGIPIFSKPRTILLRSSLVSKLIGSYEFVLASKGFSGTTSSVCECVIGGTVIFVLLIWLMTGSLLFSLIFAGAILSVGYSYAHGKQDTMKESIAQTLPDILNAIGVYYESGLSLMQAFEQAALETPGSFGKKLGKVSSDMRAGVSAEEALENLRKSSDTRALAFVTVALEVQQRTGGALKPLLQHAAKNVSDSFEMKRFLEVKTSQSRFSAKIVSIMPVILFLLMGIIEPGYIDNFLGTGAGVTIFCFAVVLEVIGILVIRRILGLNTGEV